jgi:hypothetical protein
MFVGHADFQGKLQGSQQSFGNFVREKTSLETLLEEVFFCSLQGSFCFGNSSCSFLPEMEERKTKSAALVYDRFAGAEFEVVTSFFLLVSNII